MARLYSPGPALIYVALDDLAGVVPVFLGTGETPPDIDIKRGFTPIQNDLGGESIAFDRMYDSREGLVSVVLNRYNWDMVEQMQSTVDTIAGDPGIDLPGDIGIIMGQQVRTYDLWVMFPNGSTADFPDMPRGYHFWQAFLLGPDRISTGTRDQKIHCMWQCQRKYVASAADGRGRAPVGSFVLYDTFASSFATMPPPN